MQITTSTGQESKRAISREGEASLLQMIDLSPDGILVQADNQIVFANARAVQLFEADSVQNLLSRSFLDFLHPDTQVLVKSYFEASRENPDLAETIRHQITTLNGSVIRVETTAAPMRWNAEKALQIRLRGITLQMEFETQLRESEAKFHQLADAMPQIVWMAAADGRIDYRNKKFFEQTGVIDPEGDTAKVWNLILHPDDAKKAEKNWSHSVRTGEKFQMEYRYKDLKTSEYRWHLGRALPIKDAEGRVIRWFGTCTDIHDQKLVEIALQETKEQLGESAAQLEKLVTNRTHELEDTVRSSEALNYSIAHDLRAPLRSMMGFSNALLEDYGSQLDKVGQGYAARIVASAQRMDNLIGSLLAYGRLNYEELPFGFINTQSLLDSLVHQLEPEIAQTEARVTLTKPFPTVWANEPVLKKVFAELIQNALKFHQPNQPPQIDIWAEEHETKSSIWIRDQGIGIPPEHHERIFRVMESLHVADKYPGTGIGLAIVRRGVERVGGRIGLKSAPDQGSCFWIELPKALF